MIETEETKWPLGLHPRLVPVIVAKAHAAGLQVTAHVETAEDFRHAVRSGVDEIAPVPRLVTSAADESARLTEADARLALERHVRVVTTAVAGRGTCLLPKGTTRTAITRDI